MVQNNYTDQAIQKGLLLGIAVCVEYTHALMETLFDAKQNASEIVVVWLDLANVYGSVAHYLVQLTLEWYYISSATRELIFNYYDELFIRLKTHEWTSDWFMYQIGLFQGCTLSVVLSLIDFKQSQKVYSDDLTIISGSVDAAENFSVWLKPS